MNKIYLIGRVVRDVEYVQTKNEKKMVNNCLAIDCGKTQTEKSRLCL